MTANPALDTTERYNLTLAAACVAASLALGSVAFSAAVALGSVIEAVNYRALRRATERFFAGQLGGSSAWTAGYALRFVFVGAAMGVALWAGVDPVGLVIGLSAIVPAAALAAWRNPPPAAPALPAPPADGAEWERWNPWLAREREDAEEDEES